MEKRWNDITGKMRVFKKTYENGDSYTTSLSNKKEDGTYENMYLTVQFKKDNIPTIEEKGTEIDVTKGFISFYKTKEGMPKVKLVVTEYATGIEDEGKFIELSDNAEDLPF